MCVCVCVRVGEWPVWSRTKVSLTMPKASFSTHYMYIFITYANHACVTRSPARECDMIDFSGSPLNDDHVARSLAGTLCNVAVAVVARLLHVACMYRVSINITNRPAVLITISYLSTTVSRRSEPDRLPPPIFIREREATSSAALFF